MLPTRTPPVTTNQMIRYLADRYAWAMKRGRHWNARYQDTGDNFADSCHLDSYREAGQIRRILRDLVHDQVSTWRIGTKENKP